MDMFCQCDLPIHWSLTALLRNADSWLRSLQIFQLYSHNQGFLCRSKHQFGGWSVIMSSLLVWRKKRKKFRVCVFWRKKLHKIKKRKSINENTYRFEASQIFKHNQHQIITNYICILNRKRKIHKIHYQNWRSKVECFLSFSYEYGLMF